jgi:hypothetical protein
MASLWNSPVGPKTIHFWAPVANWGFVIAGILDLGKPEEQISKNMTLTLLCYSTLFIRFAWRITPRNYILASMHITNVCVQGTLLRRRIAWEKKMELQEKKI